MVLVCQNGMISIRSETNPPKLTVEGLPTARSSAPSLLDVLSSRHRDGPARRTSGRQWATRQGCWSSWSPDLGGKEWAAESCSWERQPSSGVETWSRVPALLSLGWPLLCHHKGRGVQQLSSSRLSKCPLNSLSQRHWRLVKVLLVKHLPKVNPEPHSPRPA